MMSCNHQSTRISWEWSWSKYFFCELTSSQKNDLLILPLPCTLNKWGLVSMHLAIGFNFEGIILLTTFHTLILALGINFNLQELFQKALVWEFLELLASFKRSWFTTRWYADLTMKIPFGCLVQIISSFALLLPRGMLKKSLASWGKN